ncbi:hypothetical protein Cl131_gp025 [Aphanizomenon phage vB_AphaS-CL131]|nr:hypothetical protein Cl131_gp025 [Aphanizomenon phage vB_AphaS-CL131]
MAAFQKAIDATDRTTSLSFTDSSQPIQFAVGDLSGVSISVSGTWVGSLSFEGSVSGKSWSAIDVHLLSDNSKSATITATGQYGINPTPFSQIRIVPAVASGSALVELLAVKTSSFNWLSAIWKLISDRIPALSNGKIPVEVGSLNVSVSNASLEIANDAGNPIPISDAGGSITVDGSVSISNFPATQVVNTGLTQPLTDAQLRSAPVSVTGTFWQATQPVSAASLPLPTNAATSVLQTTGNTSLASIDTKTPVLGQALAAGSIPVVLPAAQITALTPLSTIAATQSGNWNIGSITTLPSLPTGANTIGAISNTAFSINGTLPAFTNTPTFNLGTAPNLTITNTAFTANAGSNLNTSALALESGGNLAGINTKVPSNLTVSATRLLVDGSGVTQPVSMAAAPAGLAWESTATITRAANTTAYTANDVYGGVFELTNIGASGGFVFLNSLHIIFNSTALPSGMGAFAVYLYSATPPSAITDNLPYSLNSGDRASIKTLNGLSLTASLAARGNGGSVVAEALDINQLFKLATGSTSLWGYLVTLSAFTPAANSETAIIRAVSFAP